MELKNEKAVRTYIIKYAEGKEANCDEWERIEYLKSQNMWSLDFTINTAMDGYANIIDNLIENNELEDLGSPGRDILIYGPDSIGKNILSSLSSSVKHYNKKLISILEAEKEDLPF